MSNLTAAGRATIADLARRYGLSEPAVEHMARAVANGGGQMAQFSVPELGGSGQWMSGGMTMVGDMFNQGLQATVSNLCGELSNAMASTSFFEVTQGAFASNWWPQELGSPASTGGQNQARYAHFPAARRIAFDHGDGRPVTILDTGDHQIGGFSQQQSGPGDPYQGVSVSSQWGQFALSSFPLAGQREEPANQAPQDADNQNEPPQIQSPQDQGFDAQFEAAPSEVGQTATEQPQLGALTPSSQSVDEILNTIERLAKLHSVGALSDEEFNAKKSELLARL